MAAADFPSHVSSAADMRLQLQALLDAKEKQLQQAGALGQRVLQQQVELEERIRQLHDMELDRAGDADMDADMRERYREVVEASRAWDSENAQLSSGFGSKRATNGIQPSPTLPALELSREESERPRPAAGSSNAQSRRAKNAAHRADDVEFAFEIGSGLLTEVRRLQSLLGERDKAIHDMKEEKDDLERTIESLRTALKQQEQSTDKYKEENWNLEVVMQELRAHLTDTQASVQRLEGEQKRLTRLLNQSRETSDQHKNESQRLQSSLDEFKAKHDTDIAQARKNAASLQRDKSDLQQSLDQMKTEMARQGRRLPRFGSPLTPEQRAAAGANSDFITPGDREEDDVFGGASTNRKRGDGSSFLSADRDLYDSSPDASPSRPVQAPNHPSNEVEALQQRLTHAQRQINTLKGTLQREKELKIEYRKRLESPAVSGGLGAEEDVSDDDGPSVTPTATPDANGPKSTRKSTPFRVGGRGRGARGSARGARGGRTLMDRLERAQRRPNEDDDEDDDEGLDVTMTPPVPSSEPFLGGAEIDDEETMTPDMGTPPAADESPAPPSNRSSIDGMDPAFANVLRRPMSGSMPFNRSPLRNSVAARSLPRRARGGAAFQQARPPSLVAAPEALAAELFGSGNDSMSGPGMDSVPEIVPPVETAEFGCQTEPYEEPAPPVVAITPASPETVECGIQVTPEPEPRPVLADLSMQTDEEPVVEVPKPVLMEMSMQTDEEPVPVPEPVVEVVRSEMGIQHEDVEPPKKYASTAMETDPVPEPEATPIPLPVPLPETAVAEVQTEPEEPSTPVFALPGSRADGARRETLTQISHSRDTSTDLSGDTTMRTVGVTLREQDQESDFDDNAAETEFQDARSVIAMTTPSLSTAGFHSANEGIDSGTDEDDVSIRASTPARSLAAFMRSSPYSPRVTYEEQGTQYEFEEPKLEPVVVPEPAPIPLPAPEPPKPVLKEMSIQTDEWMPPPPPPPAAILQSPTSVSPTAQPTATVPQPLTTSPSFKMSGLGFHQFQYISPPGSSNNATTAQQVSSSTRDLPASAIQRPRTSQSDRRQSIESALSGYVDDPTPRGRLSSQPVQASVDKTRPPKMTLPPPPRAPPPPNSMPPPPFIPDRARATSSDIAPGRPISPPPAELIHRATTPTFGSVRSTFSPHRQPGGSMPAPQQIGSRTSTHSFRSSNNPSAYAQGYIPPSLQAAFGQRDLPREMSQASLHSRGSVESARSSLSSDHPYFQRTQPAPSGLPVTPGRSARTSESTPASGPASTDPSVIHAITQTMIGEFLYKYTRKAIGKGHGDRRHKRFFWVHPYTKTLYWSDSDPGSSNVSESSAKSAYIEAVRSVLDPNPLPPGLYQYSVIVSTPHREMKITTPTKERHDIWLSALKYLLARPNGATGLTGTSPRSGGSSIPVPQSPTPGSSDLQHEEGRRPHLLSSPQSYRSGRSAQPTGEWNVTPRGQRSRSQISGGGSVGKRSGTPAAEYLRYMGDGPYSPTKEYEHVMGSPGDDDDLDFELHDDSMSDPGFEGLENVRACCDGKHTVGGHHHHHHHHHNHNHGNGVQNGNGGSTRRGRASTDQLLNAEPSADARPSSPAFSFRSRSRAGSATSDGGGLFSSSRLRFGSRRSAKTSTTTQGDGS